jgi:DNA-binding XRE family transcriptional regulator
MILSERQLKVTLVKLAAIEERLKATVPVKKGSSSPGKIAPEFAEAARAELEELAIELRQDVKEYQRLRRLGLKALTLKSPADFLEFPMKYRVACGLTQEQFAAKVGVSLRQIARYEAESYQNINGETLKRILEKLPLKIACEISDNS